MPRPLLNRQVSAVPDVVLFKPAGVPGCELEELTLSLDEYEALRLADYEGLYQEAAALRMGISRQTFGRIVSAARHKLAEALVCGKAIRVAGGKAVVREAEEDNFKIAVPLNGTRIEMHFGQCETYAIYTIESGTVTEDEIISCTGRHGCKSGIIAELARIGVRCLLAGNIGEGAVRMLGSFGIQTVRGASGPARQAVESYLSGREK